MASKRKLICLGLALLVLAWPIREAFSGRLGGSFRCKEIPADYLKLKDFLLADDKAATFWIPIRQRFGYYSLKQPAFGASYWIEDEKCLEPFCSLKISQFNRQYFGCHPNEKCFPADASFLANPNSLAELKKLGIRYLIIPFDSEGEIFLYERKYDGEAREKLEKFLDTIPWFKKVPVTEKIAVYEITQ